MATQQTDRQRPQYEVVVADTPELVQACYDIRIEVFVTEQGFSIDDEMDQYDNGAQVVHLLLSVLEPSDANPIGEPKRVPVGVVRIITAKNKLGRLAILKPYRSYGFGKVLVESVHDWAKSQLKKDDEKIHAIPFYEKCGYHAEGPQFEEDGAPHQKMVIDITRI
ncbi:hypothetical protein QFC22_000638 [Naganishia vaughanmartiniae]|uniref:Uncharacterized protein n=1 Tax=Naganishia vaughanmartiniae TaxID=1424756 RepID=A0ACC2XPU7_9TREE|nr:hypothetical protein QFC22_000638 [Naganishia vaughanmartiniae]